MRKTAFCLILAFLIALIPFLLVGLTAHAAEAPVPEKQDAALPVKMLIRTAWPMKNGEATDLVLQLWTDKGPVTIDSLKTVHEKKLHLFLLSPNFAEFYHLHPIATPTPGEYRVSFMPRIRAPFRAWAELTTEAGRQLVVADVNGEKMPAPSPPEHQVLSVAMDNLAFSIDFPGKPVAGKPVMGTVSVVDKETRSPVTALEPVLGAFAHIAAFSKDYMTMMHVHPAGAEPKNAADRSGPDVRFHITPTEAGTMPLFAQFRINGRDIIVPFIVNISPAPRGESAPQPAHPQGH